MFESGRGFGLGGLGLNFGFASLFAVLCLIVTPAIAVTPMVVTGQCVTLALKSDGTVVASGYNDARQDGIPDGKSL